MSKQFAMTFSVPVPDDLFAQAKIITAVEQAISAFKDSLAGMTDYELTTELIGKRQPRQPKKASSDQPHVVKRGAAAAA